MSHSTFDSHNALQQFLATSSKEQFQKALFSYSLTELANSLVILQTQQVLEAQDKINDLFEFTESPTTLEFLGKYFSYSTFLSFLEFLSKHSQYQNRLSFLLIGLPSAVFSKALSLLTDNHLHILRQEALLEPLQYQLTQFAHEGEALKQVTEQDIQQFQQEVSSIIPKELTQNKLKAFEHQIDHMKNQLLDYLQRASAALAIAWHTDRIDLIDKLSAINETIQHQLAFLIGHPAFDNVAATGIYAFWEQTFSNIFDSSLKDDDAAIEGITRLAVWHLKDYWEVGLFPSIHHPEELDLDPNKYNEKERLDHHQKLILQVQQQLERLGIGKVANLKKLHLFSKSLLKDYIEQHHHLLLT